MLSVHAHTMLRRSGIRPRSLCGVPSIYCKNAIKSSYQCSELTRYNLWDLLGFYAFSHPGGDQSCQHRLSGCAASRRINATRLATHHLHLGATPTTASCLPAGAHRAVMLRLGAMAASIFYRIWVARTARWSMASA